MIDQLLQEEDYYAILGVSRSATSAQIQKAYRRRAVQTHPDKVANGDRRAFDKVAEAYDVLNDETKRALYSRYGKRGLEGHTGGQHPGNFAEDVFRSFFGNQFHSSFRPNSQQQQRSPRNRTVQYQLEVSLEDLYTGKTRSVLIEKPGKGQKRVSVDIPAGLASGESVVLSGEVDAIPEAAPGDLVFVVSQRSHGTFTRKGHDLAIEITVSLQEAICGLTREIRHLDGRPLVISSARSSVDTPMLIETGDVHVLKGAGMPKRGEDGAYGDLYVQYRVRMPPASSVTKLDATEREQLGSLLGRLQGDDAKTSPPTSAHNNAKTMEKASPADFGRASGPFRRQRADYEEDFQQGPFAQQFFWSNRGRGRSPFGDDHPNDDDDGSNVQCQQM